MTGEVILDSWWARCADQDSSALAKTRDHGKFWNLSLLAGPSTWTGLVLALPPAVSLQTCSTPAAAGGQDHPSESGHTQATYTHTDICLCPHILFIILFGLRYVWILWTTVIAFAWNYKIRSIWVNKLCFEFHRNICLFTGFWIFSFLFFNLICLFPQIIFVCFWLYGCSRQKIRLNCYLFFSIMGEICIWPAAMLIQRILNGKMTIKHKPLIVFRRFQGTQRNWAARPLQAAAANAINPTL